MPNTVMGVPYPLPTDMVRDGATAMQNLAKAVPSVAGGAGGAGNRPDVRVWAQHGGFTTNQYGQLYIQPVPNLSTLLYVNGTHIITAADQEPFQVVPYYGNGFGVGPTAVFAVRHAGQANGWVVNSFVVIHALIIGF